ncbi:pentatricopeptide repeat-containing protein [Forsythia ovata]|uniref:Pentatricopeptide repeat-containing protein n=1 Tax=Forsythia ovata TaxID=205694 RepID=A0ABD1WN31_9LAMI
MSNFLMTNCEKGMLENAKYVMKMFINNVDIDSKLSIDVVGFNTLIHGYCKAGEVSGGLKLVKCTTKAGLLPDIAAYNTLIDGLCEMGDFESAKSLMDEFLEQNVSEAGDDEKEERVVLESGLTAISSR